MLTDEDFEGTVEYLTGEHLGLRVGMLKVSWESPSADPRVLPYLEDLLHDKTPCVLGHPYVFGEIRWLAAKALAAERAALGINEPVRATVVSPAETRDIIKGEYEANIQPRGGVEGLLSNLAILRDMGYMPMVELNLWPLGPASTPLVPATSMKETFREPELVPAV